MSVLEPGTVVDGFTLDDCIHTGASAHIYRVHYADGQADPGFAMAMKLPHLAAGDGADNTIRFETECQALQVLKGRHVPRFVATGDPTRLPYLVMEYVSGRTLEQQMVSDATPDVAHITSLGIAMARAAHALHQQNTVHLDLKPANVLFRDDGSAVLLGFGLSTHAHYPDLLADPMHKAVGSPAWIAPEQVVGVRGDPRSDIFAIGVMLYQLCTGALPFGEPTTADGLRRRLWVAPVPPRKVKALLPEWLQEVVLYCLEPLAHQRYPSAAHLAFDVSHPTQVAVTARGRATRGAGVVSRTIRRIKAVGIQYRPSPLPAQQVEEVPIVMVAIPPQGVSDAMLVSLQLAVRRALGTRPGARLACVTVLASGLANPNDGSDNKVQRHHLSRLRLWAQPLDQPGHQTSCHVLESGDVAHALLQYAKGHAVSTIVMGAATHSLETPHFMATIPFQVALHAPCTVVLAKQTLPFELLGTAENGTPRVG